MKGSWSRQFNLLIKQYGERKHPLEYENRFQLVIMVILSAQCNDKHINKIAKSLFKTFPMMNTLAKASVEDIQREIKTVPNFKNKSKWLSELANLVVENSNIPTSLGELTKLPGIGRKSANVIIRESGYDAEGIIVDLHVVRVAPRLGIASGTDPLKIEKQLMNFFPKVKWNDVGMAISFLGREICRPTNPKCAVCVMNTVCNFYKS